MGYQDVAFFTCEANCCMTFFEICCRSCGLESANVLILWLTISNGMLCEKS